MTRQLAVAGLAVLLALLGGTGATAAETTITVGTADTTVNLGTLSADGLAIDLDAVTLGALRSFASTDDDKARNVMGAGRPFALAEALLPAGQRVAASSGGPTSSPGQTVALPAGAGTLTVGALEAVAKANDARATVDALSGQVDAVLAGLTASVPATGAVTTVDAKQAAATNGAALRDLSVGLGEVLPADLLAQLPLETLLDLLEDLPVDTSSLEGVITQLEEVLADVEELQQTTDEIDTVVAEVEAAIAPIEEALGAGDVIDTTLVTDVVDQLQAVQDGPVADLTDELSANLGALLGTVEDLTATDIDALLEDLLDGLDGLELVAVDDLTVGVAATASETASNATAVCTVSGVRVLGQAVPDVDTCAELTQQLDTLRTTLLGVLSALPVLGEVAETTVTLQAPTTTTSAPNALDGDYHVASASVDGLNLGVASLSLEAVSGGLAEDLLGAIEELLAGDLDAVLDGDLTDLIEDSPLPDGLLDDGIDGLVDGLVELVDELTDVVDEASGGATGDTGDDVDDTTEETAEDVTEAVDEVLDTIGVGTDDDDGLLRQLPPGVSVDQVTGALDGLGEQLGGLPTGAALDGLTTPSLGLSALDVTAASSFDAATASVPAPPVQPQVPSNTTTGNRPPAQVQPGQNLPRTGGGVAMALLLLATGAGATAWIRRRPESDNVQ